MSSVRVSINNGRFEMETPYSTRFINAIKTIGSARWDRDIRCWTVAEEDKPAAQQVLMQVFGEDGEHARETVRVKIRAKRDVCVEWAPVQVAGKILATARGRDSGARAGDDVVVESGKIDSGGSRNHWTSVVCKDAVLVLSHVLPEMVDTISTYDFEILEVAKEGVKSDALRAEREKLIARIAEIDAMLADIDSED